MPPVPELSPSVPETCPICQSQALKPRLHVETTTAYRIEECCNCGLVFALPRPTPEELNAFYSSAYFRKDGQRLGYIDYRGDGEANARNMWGEMEQVLHTSTLQPKRLLDVGCATGGFLHEAQKAQWGECLGVELSQAAVEVCREEHGLNVVLGDVFSESLPTAYFGLITMFHVLEHTIEPFAVLRRVQDLLVPGGLLFIELPNWNSMGRVARSARWAQLKPPEHINFFTPKSLRIAVEKLDFDVQWSISHYESAPSDRSWAQPMNHLKYLSKQQAAKQGRGGYVRLLAKKR